MPANRRQWRLRELRNKRLTSLDSGECSHEAVTAKSLWIPRTLDNVFAWLAPGGTAVLDFPSDRDMQSANAEIRKRGGVNITKTAVAILMFQKPA